MPAKWTACSHALQLPPKNSNSASKLPLQKFGKFCKFVNGTSYTNTNDIKLILRMTKLKLCTLENGVRLLTVSIKEFPLSISSFWIRAGSRKDPKDKTGLAHFFEHLLLTRTKKNLDRQARLVEIEKMGLFFNAYASLETANYYYIHPLDKTRQALKFLIDGFTASIVGSKDLEEERQVILDEERRNRNNPSSYIWRAANYGLWPKSKMGSSFFGDKQSIKAISLNDFKNFYNKYYVPANTVFVLLNPNRKDLNKYRKIIEDIPSQTTKVIKHLDILGKKKGLVFEQREIDYFQLSLSFLTCSRLNINDCIILDFIKSYLASGWISKLISRLRIENKYTYWVSGDNLNLEDTGYLRFSLSTDVSNVEKVLKIFEEEIIALKTKSISSYVLEWHKNKYQSDLIRNSLDPEFLLSWYGLDISVINQKPIIINEHLNAIKKIKPADLMHVARKYLNRENFSLTLLGPNNRIKNIPGF